nr:BrnA antitoxin family protein [Treponema denticola]
MAWLKSYGKGYQSRINTILRQAMDTDKKANVF